MVRRTFEQPLNNLLAWPGEDAKSRLLLTSMVGGLLIPILHQLGHLRHMFLIQPDEDDRVGTRMVGKPFGRAGLAIPHGLSHLGKGLHISLMQQTVHAVFQRGARHEHQHLHWHGTPLSISGLRPSR